jgi:ArsR family transcriptional regulator, virulence genes transcriptional regulator
MYHQMFELHADLLKALSHPSRLEIIHLLREQELCVSDIYSMLDLPQAKISQHLMTLRDAGIVTTRKDGKQVFYQISHPQIVDACDAMREVLIEQYKGSAMADALTMKMSDLLPIVHDPVCQMRVSPKTAGFSLSHNGNVYYFCASGCMKHFKERPEKYI